MQQPEEFPPIEKEKKPSPRRPSCLLEGILFFVLLVATLAGLGTILAPYLDNLLNSVFGMGLK